MDNISIVIDYNLYKRYNKYIEIKELLEAKEYDKALAVAKKKRTKNQNKLESPNGNNWHENESLHLVMNNINQSPEMEAIINHKRCIGNPSKVRVEFDREISIHLYY